MHRYAMMKDYSEIINVPEEFKECFNVDLDSVQFKKYHSLEERWNSIIEATNLHKNEVSYQKLGKLNFEDYLETYMMYEWDVWLNTYFSIKYMEADKTLDETYIKGVSSDVHKLRDFELPFDKKIITKFCSAYKLYFYTKERKSIFDVKKIFVTDEEIVENLKNIKFNNNLYMEAWSYKKIAQAEFNESFDTEDRILFYKTIDCNLARKLTLYNYYKGDLSLSCEEKDFVHMCIEKRICQIDSFAWKNLYVDSQIKAVRMVNGLVDMSEDEYEKFIKEWMEKQKFLLELGATIISNSEKINKRLRVLSRGLIYCILNFSTSQSEIKEVVESVVKEKAEQAMEILMELGNREYQVFSLEGAKELRFKSAEYDILKFYALTQAKVILYNPKYGWNK